MARFNETTEIRPAATMNVNFGDLASRLEGFAQQQASNHAQKTAEKSFSAGVSSFKEGESPQFKEEKFFGNVASTNYNKGLRAAYVASLDRDNREEIARITAENPSDISKFNDQVEAYRSAMLANVDPSVRQVVQDSTDSLISANRIRVQNREIEQTYRESGQEVSAQIEAATNDALGFARDGDDLPAAESAVVAMTSVDAAVDAGFITPEQGAAQKRDIEKGITEQKLKGDLFRTFESEGMRPAYDKLIEMADKRPNGFEPDEWDKFVGQTQAELNRRVAREEREQVLNASAQKKALSFDAIEKRLDGDDSQIIDYKNADAYYQERVAPAIQDLPPELKRTAQANYIDRLKVVPDSLVAEVTNAAQSNNAELLANASKLIDRIDDIPGVVNKIPKNEQAYIDTVTSLMQNMTPEEAVDLARKATDPKDKGRIEAVDQSIKELRKDEPDIYHSRSQDAFASLFVFGDPVPNELAQDNMAKEYGSIYESFRRAGSSDADAFKKADKYIKRTWGETSVLGKKEVMKFPPDDYYAIDGDVSWIKDQLMRDVVDQSAGQSVDDVFLMSNDITSRTATAGRPSYAVKIMIDGVFYNAGQWQPDYDAEVEKRKSMKVKEALEMRERRLKGGVDVNNIARGSRGL